MLSVRFQTQLRYNLHDLQPVASGYFMETKWRMQRRIAIVQNHTGTRWSIYCACSTRNVQPCQDLPLFFTNERANLQAAWSVSLWPRDGRWQLANEMLLTKHWRSAKCNVCAQTRKYFLRSCSNQVTLPLQCHHILGQPRGPGYVHAVPGCVCMTLIISHVL